MSSLVAHNLSCQKGYNLLFNKLSFIVSSGDVLRVTGANGSGKTSLLKILAGLSMPDQGRVSFYDYKVQSSEYQQSVFYLGHLSLISAELTSLENLQFLTRLNSTKNQQLIQALHDIGLKGYENEYCSKLSAGQKRRVILAGLFVSNAKVWLLDEPFTALDLKGIKIVEKLINQHVSQQGLCVLTTHQNLTLTNQKFLAL